MRSTSRITDHGSRTADHESRITSPAFTLIEIMIVIAIMAIVMTMSVPMIYKIWHREAMRQAVLDLEEVCNSARTQAIMQGKEVDLTINPQEKLFQVSGGATGSGGPPTEGNSMTEIGNNAPAHSGLSAQIPENIAIELLDINLVEYKDAETARVRFYPNGTCDELRIVLHSLRADERIQDQRREIMTEVTTSRTIVETDPTKFR
jgi:prepilin-type N-terminal cleavage/methylation domain-containing protein